MAGWGIWRMAFCWFTDGHCMAWRGMAWEMFELEGVFILLLSLRGRVEGTRLRNERREKTDSSQNCMEGDIRQEALDTQSKLRSKQNNGKL
jgi:hypothetical protein